MACWSFASKLFLAVIVAMSVAASTALLFRLGASGQEASLQEAVARLQARVEAQEKTIRLLRGAARTVDERYQESLSQPEVGAGLLNQFDLSSRLRPGVGIFVVVDKHFEVSNFRQLVALRCYAHRHGYAFKVLPPGTSCGYRVIFFQKHCRVAEELRTHPAGFTAFVMDADVVPVVMDRNLDEYMRGGEDIVFYEREWSPEIAAGNYLVRNTPFALNFLKEWENYAEKAPKNVFSSTDNGAILVLLLEVLKVPCAGYVRQLYDNLTNDGIDKLGVPLPYKNFGAAAMMARGPPRQWVGVRLGDAVGRITVLPRMHAWVMDGEGSWNTANVRIGAVFHHRVKTLMDMNRYYEPGVGLETCTVRPEILTDEATYTKSVASYISAMATQYGFWDLPAGHPVPFFMAAVHCCVKALQCRAMRPGEALRVGAASFPDPWTARNASGSLPQVCGAKPSITEPVPLPPCNGG